MDVRKIEPNDHQIWNIQKPLIEGDQYGICCCCLESVCRKIIWSEYTWMGSSEVYSDMLQECFGLTVTRDTNTIMYICELCITTLRNVLHFRRQVVRCHGEMVQQIANFIPGSIQYCAMKKEKVMEERFVDYVKGQGLNVNATPVEVASGEIVNSCDDDGVKLVDGRTKVSKNRTNNYVKTRRNVCLILEHSTLTPFRSNRGYFNCFYCGKQHAVFDELKSHMAEKHEGVNFKRILKSISRPDVVKADCSDVTCKLCSTRLGNVDDLIEHLTVAHKIVFNHENKLKPKDCILGYNLSEGRYRCSVCDKEFHFFKTLSKHMNEHSANYVCDVCGRCFFLPERLRAHKLRHADKSVVECEQCGKVCPSKILLKSHVRYNHNKSVYVCKICEESYRSFKERLRHMETVHGRKLNLSCQFCGKCFKTPSSLNVHVKTDHLNVVSGCRFHCESCPMTFKSRSALKCHGVVHSRERSFECEVCFKRYGRSRTLVEHLKIHRNDRRWSCAECGHAFVQKCSLRNHIRVHHSSRDADLLILYKKKPMNSKVIKNN